MHMQLLYWQKIESDILLLTILQDVPHVGKILKASF